MNNHSLCQCGKCSPDMVFQCEECKKIVPWCLGAADDYEELCDDCAAKHIEDDDNLQDALDKAVKNLRENYE